MNLLFDLKYSVRVLLKTPGFTLLTIAVMTIGLGVSIFMASIVTTLVIKPLDFKDGNRLMNIIRLEDGRPQQPLLHDFEKIRDESKSFEFVTAFESDTAVLSDGVKSIRYQGINCAQHFFEYTEVEPLLGRVLNSEDNTKGALPVVVIGYELWQNYFGGNPNIIGSTVMLNRESVEVVGVMPKDFLFPFNNQLWIPYKKVASDFKLKGSPRLRMLAKTKPGISAIQASLEVNTILKNSPELHANPKQELGVEINTFKKTYLGNAIKIFFLMLSAALFVLALSCINVGNLLLARANARSKEIAIRVALGAPRVRLIFQMIWESFFICSLGGLFAVLLAGAALDATTQYFLDRSTDGFPYWAKMQLTIEDVFFGIAITVLTALFTGLVPAWKTSSGDFNAVLKDGSKTALGKTTSMISKVLVAVEIALSTALMVIAGIIFILIQQAVAAGYGISLDNYLTARVNPPETVYPSGSAQIRYFDRVLAEASVIPGVQKATLVSHAPTEWASSSGFEPEGQEFPDYNYPRANYVRAYPNTFETLNIPILEGRGIDARDDENSPQVVVVSQALAETFWPGESPLGKRIRRISAKESIPSDWMTVVGVVATVIQGGMFDDNLSPTMYVPFRQMTRDVMAIILKTTGDPNSYQVPLANVLHKIDPNIPMYRFTTLTAQAEDSRSFMEFAETVFALFAFCALVMAATGIYGVMANHVEQRTQELGIRRAVGAQNSSIVRLLMRQSSMQLLLGFLIGLPLAYIMGQNFVSLIGASNSWYLWIYIIVPLFISFVVFIATLLPLRHIFRLEPAQALRYE